MSFLSELKQRKVVRVATGYLVAAWIAIQAASIALPAFDAPAWTLRVFILMFVLGFPLALLLSWALDVTPDGVKATPRREGNALMALTVATLVALAIGWYFFGQPYGSLAPPAPTETATAPLPAPAAVPATTAATAPAAIIPANTALATAATAAVPSRAAIPPPRQAQSASATAAGNPAAGSPLSTASASDSTPAARQQPDTGKDAATDWRQDPHKQSSRVAECKELAQRIYARLNNQGPQRPMAERLRRRVVKAELQRSGCIDEARNALLNPPQR